MSQPCQIHANVPQPGQVDSKLNEFWIGNPWQIFEKENLSCFERNRFWINAGGRSFLDASFVSGADHDGDSRSVVAIDFDHDGKQDLLLRQAGGGPLVAYKNQFATGRAVTVLLRGRKSPRSGVGARLIAQVGNRRVVRECYPANGFRAQAPLATSLGLGDAEKLDELTVRWPSGIEQRFRDLPAGGYVVVTEDEPEFMLAKPGETIAP